MDESIVNYYYQSLYSIFMNIIRTYYHSIQSSLSDFQSFPQFRSFSPNCLTFTTLSYYTLSDIKMCIFRIEDLEIRFLL